MGAGSVDRTPHARAPQIGKSKRWRIRVSIPVPRRCERRTLPIELIPHSCDCFGTWACSHPPQGTTGHSNPLHKASQGQKVGTPSWLDRRTCQDHRGIPANEPYRGFCNENTPSYNSKQVKR